MTPDQINFLATKSGLTTSAVSAATSNLGPSDKDKIIAALILLWADCESRHDAAEDPGGETGEG